jgi:hypothetical protein
MNTNASKTAALEFFSVFLALPFVICLTLYFSARWWSVNPHKVLVWLKVVRWIAWVFGLAAVLLEFGAMSRGRYPIYGLSMMGCSAGLAFPENWVKHRFAPEPIQSNCDT